AGALLAGTIGLALTIPLTAFLISRWWKGGDEAQQRHAPPPAPAKGLFSVGGLLLIAAALTVVAFVWLGRTSHSYFRHEGPADASLMRGKVLSADPALSPWAPREKGPGKEILQHLTVRLSNGREVAALNALQLSPVDDRVPQVGERAIFLVSESDPDMPAMLIEIERDRGLLLMVFAACMVVVLVGRWQGWRAVGALAVCLALVGVLLVSIVRLGTPPILTTLMYMLVVTGLTFLIICGWNHKALGATAGALAGLAAAGVAALALGSWLGLSGLYDRDMQTLFWRSAGRGLDFQALLTSAALVGALGVVMDVSIGIASAVSEVRRANPATPFRPLLSAGFAVGRKIMAAMFGAILFAYLGLNIGLFLLPWAETGSAWQVLENERVRSEVFRIGIAGLAIVWSIPATAVISAYLASRKTQTVVTADVEES
ncbi:MAG: YibE/F family protein, partial [Planctomycetia bacterium]|nr:YibE/F family protein [Planctomycetia bacterium]